MYETNECIRNNGSKECITTNFYNHSFFNVAVYVKNISIYFYWIDFNFHTIIFKKTMLHHALFIEGTVISYLLSNLLKVLLEVFKGNEQIDSNKSPKYLINLHNYIKQQGLSLCRCYFWFFWIE